MSAMWSVRLEAAIIALEYFWRSRSQLCRGPAATKAGGLSDLIPNIGRYRKAIAAASLVVGPLLMSVGDLLHPEERWDAAWQAAIIFEQSSRWYVAHLLLFIGLLLFIPGILALTRLTSEQRPTAGYAGQILLMIGTGAFCAVFVCEIGGRLRWPALVLGVGAFLILAEIITAKVLLSQIGNVVILAASVTFAWQILHPPARLMAPAADTDLSSAWRGAKR